jgi:hypothetical protein
LQAVVFDIASRLALILGASSPGRIFSARFLPSFAG